MKKTITAIIIFGSLILSIVLVLNSDALSKGTAKIIDDEFLLTFIGMFTSLAIAVIAFLYSNVEKIRATLLKSNQNKKTEIESQFDQIFKELKDDTLLTLISLITCFFVIVFRDIDFSFIKISIVGITKMQMVSIIELSSILLTFAAITDIFIALFNLIKASKGIELSQEEK